MEAISIIAIFVGIIGLIAVLWVLIMYYHYNTIAHVIGQRMFIDSIKKTLGENKTKLDIGNKLFVLTDLKLYYTSFPKFRWKWLLKYYDKKHRNGYAENLTHDEVNALVGNFDSIASYVFLLNLNLSKDLHDDIESIIDDYYQYCSGDANSTFKSLTLMGLPKFIKLSTPVFEFNGETHTIDVDTYIKGDIHKIMRN